MRDRQALTYPILLNEAPWHGIPAQTPERREPYLRTDVGGRWTHEGTRGKMDGIEVEGEGLQTAGYAKADVIYLLGTDDTDPAQADLDTSCAGEAEGPERLDRGKFYYHYLRSRHLQDFGQ